MSDSKTHISVAESKVMEALWHQHPLTAEDITARVATSQDWSTGTVKSLLNRLLSKGAITAEKDGRRYLYSPLLSREDYVSAEGMGLINRLFDGSVSSMITHFSEQKKLTSEDVVALKKLIEELDDD